MAFALNSVTISGNATRDPETRQVGDTTVTKFGLAHNERRKVAGDWQDVASFFDVEVWGKFGEAIAKQVARGSQVTVVGQIRVRRYEKDGAERSITEITAHDVLPSGQSAGHKENLGGGSFRTADQAAAAIGETFGATRHGAEPAGGAIPPQEDDIPFAPSVI